MKNSDPVFSMIWKSPAGWVAPVEKQGRLVALLFKDSEVLVREELHAKYPSSAETETELLK